MYAARNGLKNVVDTLLEHGARVDLTTKVSVLQLQQSFKYIKLLMCISVSH